MIRMINPDTTPAINTFDKPTPLIVSFVVVLFVAVIVVTVVCVVVVVVVGTALVFIGIISFFSGSSNTKN